MTIFATGRRGRFNESLMREEGIIFKNDSFTIQMTTTYKRL
jgi:hypothetical protein